MRHTLTVTLCTLLAFPAAFANEQPLLESSRMLTQRFATQLLSELQTALKEGGPEQAVTVCRDRAPQIAAEFSRLSGAKISRTSRRFRNASNAPEPWQTEVLADYFAAVVPGTDKRVEYFSRNGRDVRYMQAIRLGAVCTICHGQTIAPSLQEKLDADYPYDQARGYSVGDLRGAFSVIWPRQHALP